MICPNSPETEETEAALNCPPTGQDIVSSNSSLICPLAERKGNSEYNKAGRIYPNRKAIQSDLRCTLLKSRLSINQNKSLGSCNSDKNIKPKCKKDESTAGVFS